MDRFEVASLGVMASEPILHSAEDFSYLFLPQAIMQNILLEKEESTAMSSEGAAKQNRRRRSGPVSNVTWLMLCSYARS